MTTFLAHSAGLALFLKSIPDVVDAVGSKGRIYQGFYRAEEELPQVGIRGISKRPLTHERAGAVEARVQVTVTAHSLAQAREIAALVDERIASFEHGGLIWDTVPENPRERPGEEIQQHLTDYMVIAQ